MDDVEIMLSDEYMKYARLMGKEMVNENRNMRSSILMDELLFALVIE